MVCHSLLQWTTFCQNSPPWPILFGSPHTAWLSFTELDKAVVHVIRLASFLWLQFQCVCPLMPSCNTYHLTWVSLTLNVGYLVPMEKKCKKAKWLSGKDLQIAVKRREVKSKGEKERCKHLNAEFQRIARRDKKAFHSDQCKDRGKQQNGKD